MVSDLIISYGLYIVVFTDHINPSALNSTHKITISHSNSFYHEGNDSIVIFFAIRIRNMYILKVQFSLACLDCFTKYKGIISYDQLFYICIHYTCIIDLIQISQRTTHFHGPCQSLHLAGFKFYKVVSSCYATFHPPAKT